MILYYIIIILWILIIIYGYLKVKYRFWYNQPIFHIYDLHYYLYPGIINTELPEEENIYYNFKNIKTIPFEKVTEKDEFILFIQNNFLRNKNFNYLPKKENIIPYLTGLHGGDVFLSLYKRERMIHEQEELTEIIASMISYPIQIRINNQKMNAYYVDYLCVDSDHRKKNIAPQMIQTHHYYQRHLNKSITVSVFKREGRLNLAIPICVYTSYGFSISNMRLTPLPININLIEVGKNNITHLFNFVELNNTKFDIFLSTYISNVLELIKTENIYVYMLIQEQNVLAVYYFKKLCTYLQDDKEVLVCYASVNCCKNEDIFIEGMYHSIKNIIKRFPKYVQLYIEGLSDNYILINDLHKMANPLYKIISAYFFYNLANPSFQPEKTLILL
jgi:hypothetical protein